MAERRYTTWHIPVQEKSVAQVYSDTHALQCRGYASTEWAMFTCPGPRLDPGRSIAYASVPDIA
eukprot:3941719-Rhodomonas_salina.1